MRNLQPLLTVLLLLCSGCTVHAHAGVYSGGAPPYPTQRVVVYQNGYRAVRVVHVHQHQGHGAHPRRPQERIRQQCYNLNPNVCRARGY